MEKNIYEIVVDLLKTKEKYMSDDGKLLKAKIYSDIITMNKELIEILMNNEKIKQEFFVEVKDGYVFDKQKFAWFVESKEFLPDSYTMYANKIGLTYNNNFLNEINDVVIDFPYKDCYLEGGQTKEDEKKDEIMYHEIIASDEINRMLLPKVFTNLKRYSAIVQKDLAGEIIPETIEIKEETEVELKVEDNLIIKGNNLLAISSLLKNYEGKIKLIYIDPPYNTGGDGFKYNDRFNHSTWLLFMKNRLEIAKKLLSDDGSIFIQLDHNEVHYAKVLMDEIFGRENFINEIIWRYRTYIGQVKDYFPRKHDNILWYKKKEIKYFDQTNVGNFEDTPDYQRWINYINEKGEIIYGNHPETDSRFQAYLKKYIKQNGEPKKGDIIYINKGYVVDDVWEDIIALDAKNETERIKGFGGSGQKPEALIKRIIQSVTKPGDIVLDYHLGSGTTIAVAHKMSRKYIGIEQMDYIQTITLERMKEVMKGEQGGISKSVNWKGGGSFVYCELKENALELINEISSATEENINQIKDKVYNDNRIVYYLKKSELEEGNEEFNKLSLEEKKQALIHLINKNKLYVNYCDIDDEDYKVTEEEKKFTKSFYERK